jgi:hypothetical protein
MREARLMDIETTHTYHWLNITTGKSGTSETDTQMTTRTLLEKLNEWNRSNPGVWQYWAVV